MPDDLLDKLWGKVINLDTQGRWFEQANLASNPSPFRDVPGILSRLLAAGASREDLGRVGRRDRYEACFSTLYALDDPGPGRRKLGTLAAVAEKAVAPSRGRRAANDDFVSALREILETQEDEETIAEQIRQCAQRPKEPFADVGSALQRLTSAGATPADIARLSSWHRYEACRLTLQLAAEAGYDSPDELAGSHESLLGADPSGKDGGPGSWPVAVEEKPSPRQRQSADPTQPCLSLKGVQGFAFTPDSKNLVAETQLLDAASGALRLEYEARGELRAFDCSPDGTRVYYAVGQNGFIICDARTGRQISKTQRRSAGHLGWFFLHPQTGDLLVQDIHRVPAIPPSVSDTCAFKYSLLDGRTLKPKGTWDFTPRATLADHFAFSPDGSRLASFWSQPGGDSPKRLTVWRWPEAIVAWEAPVEVAVLPWAVAWTADSRRVAIGHTDVVVFDAATGREQLRLKPIQASNHVAFSPDGRHIVTGAHSGDRIQIWDATTGRLLRELPLPKPWCFGVSVSPDGSLLGAVSHRVTCFWRFQPLIAE